MKDCPSNPHAFLTRLAKLVGFIWLTACGDDVSVVGLGGSADVEQDSAGGTLAADSKDTLNVTFVDQEQQGDAVPTGEECGDGVVVLPELCDDGNNEDGDGCSANCIIELFPPTLCSDNLPVAQYVSKCEKNPNKPAISSKVKIRVRIHVATLSDGKPLMDDKVAQALLVNASKYFKAAEIEVISAGEVWHVADPALANPVHDYKNVGCDTFTRLGRTDNDAAAIDLYLVNTHSVRDENGKLDSLCGEASGIGGGTNLAPHQSDFVVVKMGPIKPCGEATVAHEIGHLLGLWHTFSSSEKCADTPEDPNCCGDTKCTTSPSCNTLGGGMVCTDGGSLLGPCVSACVPTSGQQPDSNNMMSYYKDCRGATPNAAFSLCQSQDMRCVIDAHYQYALADGGSFTGQVQIAINSPTPSTKITGKFTVSGIVQSTKALSKVSVTTDCDPGGKSPAKIMATANPQVFDFEADIDPSFWQEGKCLLVAHVKDYTGTYAMSAATQIALSFANKVLTVPPVFPYSSGETFGVTQSWHELYNKKCLGDGHIGNIKYAIDFNQAGNADCGKNALSAYLGVVVTAKYGSNGGYGNVVIVNHGLGVYSLYGHLEADSLAVAVGDKVAAGALLGRIGSTGNSTGCHLHFQLHDSKLTSGSSLKFDGFGASGGVPTCGGAYLSDTKPIYGCGQFIGDACPGPCACASNDDCAQWESDDDKCVNNWVCKDSKCKPSQVVSCPQSVDLCKSNLCDPKSGKCEPVPLQFGLECNDGDVCTVADQCDSKGKCVGVENCASGCKQDTDCPGPAETCQLSACDKKSGMCATAAKVDGTSCDADKDACTTDACTGGTCKLGAAKICSDNNNCTTDTCDKASGNCVFASIGGCVGCATAGDCNDSNPCTTDACIGGKCSKTANSAPCDADSNACTPDFCAGGVCKAGQPQDCNDGNICTADDCDKPSGKCTHSTIPGCNNECKGDSDCKDKNACTKDTCSAGKCVFSPTDGGDCDDGDGCTEIDKCGKGACVGQKLNCDDGNPCTMEACNAGICEFTTVVASCNDGNSCTSGDSCDKGKCLGKPLACNDGNLCTKDTCIDGQCLTSPIVGPCDDGDACSSLDACANGKCTGTFKACDDGKACTIDACKAGQCVSTSAPDGGSCNDSNACTSGDVCKAGMCSGSPASCDDKNKCTDDSCDKVKGCVFANNTATCDDNSKCTNNDTCVGGSCNGTGVVCNDSKACTTDSCDPAKGCVFTNNTAACTDDNACTDKDLCNGGACTPGATVICNDGNLCTTDTCDKLKGCMITNNALGCDDKNACTIGDKCSLGKCAGSGGPNCDDNNPCTDDGCTTASGCSHTNNTAKCTDGNACTAPDLCGNAACKAGAAVSCNDNNPCTDDSCDNLAGCKHVANALTCSDGNACTNGDKCGNSACAPGVALVCNDNKPCTNDSCNPASGCVYANNNLPCNDSNACTQNDACSGGACAGAALTCNDNNVCTTDACDKAQGCTFKPNGLACDDKNSCTDKDLCGNGSCAGSKKACDDNNQCTTDSCNPTSGCVFTNNTVTCNDNSTCTSSDVCALGKCAGKPITCDDSNPCTDESCNPASGCTFAPNTKSCNDSDACTNSDKCGAGKCSGTPVSCDDNNVCTSDSCGKVAGCAHVANTFACDDKNPCTTGDKCLGGSCGAGVPKLCDDGNTCTDDDCNLATGNCVKINNSLGCSDENACTSGDKCLGGSCAAGQLKPCDDGKDCTADSCDPATGNCNFVPSQGPCNDGDPCTSSDMCSSGACSGSVKNCDDSNPCTTDSPCSGGACPKTNNSLGCTDDGNPCTADQCSGGSCQHPPTNEGGSCGGPNTCQSGQCLCGASAYWSIGSSANSESGFAYDTGKGTKVSVPDTMKLTVTVSGDKLQVTLCKSPGSFDPAKTYQVDVHDENDQAKAVIASGVKGSGTGCLGPLTLGNTGSYTAGTTLKLKWQLSAINPDGYWKALCTPVDKPTAWCWYGPNSGSALAVTRTCK